MVYHSQDAGVGTNDSNDFMASTSSECKSAPDKSRLGFGLMGLQSVSAWTDRRDVSFFCVGYAIFPKSTDASSPCWALARAFLQISCRSP